MKLNLVIGFLYFTHEKNVVFFRAHLGPKEFWGKFNATWLVSSCGPSYVPKELTMEVLKIHPRRSTQGCWIGGWLYLLGKRWFSCKFTRDKRGNIMAEAYLGGGLKYLLFSSLPGEMTQFD